jgi:hypothetical protein
VPGGGFEGAQGEERRQTGHARVVSANNNPAQNLSFGFRRPRAYIHHNGVDENEPKEIKGLHPMNEQIFAAAAAASVLAATAAHATPNATLQAFLDEAYSQAQAQLGDAVIGQPVKVRGYVGGDGRLLAVRVLNSAGSREADLRIETAVKKVRVRYVPPELIGAQVNLAFGPADARLAKTP